MTDAQDPTAVPRQLRRLVSWQANRVATLGTRLTLQRMASADRAVFAVLAALAEFGDLSQADIGRHLALDRNDVNAVATRLEEDGLVDRRVDPDDRRRKLLTMTSAGSARLAELEAGAAVVQDELLAGLTPAERERVIDLLGKLLDAHGPMPA